MTDGLAAHFISQAEEGFFVMIDAEKTLFFPRNIMEKFKNSPLNGQKLATELVSNFWINTHTLKTFLLTDLDFDKYWGMSCISI